MFRPLMALVLYCLLFCVGLVLLAFGVKALGAVGANGFIYPFYGLGFLTLFPLSFVLAGRLVLWIRRDGKV
jgi:hypothetical protein